jgi:dTDP-glucose 4,6-dehydratase
VESSNSINRVLITGGAGFLGSHLCERLLDLGCEVICMDNLITGDADNVAHLWERPGFRFINYDVSNFIHVEGALDAVLHFASPASPRDYLQFPLATLKVGSQGTQATLDLSEANGARYILASTSEVYGDPLVSPQPESYWGNVNPVSPRGVYDEAKRFSESMTMAYHRYHGLDTRIVRIFNTYGPRMRPNDGRVVSNFIVQACKGEVLTVYGDGSQTRSFCYVEDTVEGIMRVLFKDSDRSLNDRTNKEIFLYSTSANGHPSIHDPINIGNPHEMSVLELAKLILQLMGRDSSVELKPLPVDDPRVRRPDITRARMLLGWEPRFGIEEGLARTIEHFRARLSPELPTVTG